MTDSTLQNDRPNTCPYSALNLADIDPRAADFMDDPFDFYRLIRSEAPVYREESSGIYFVGSYELIAKVMRDPKNFSSSIDRPSMRIGGVPERVREIKAKGWSPPHTMTRNDDIETHDAFRSLVSAHFLPKTIVALEPYVRDRTDELLATIKEAGECDFVTAFSVPLPIAVIARYLGFDDCGDAAVKRWSDALVDQIGLLSSEERAIEVAELELECHRHILQLCERRRAEPKDDLITVLARASLPDGRSLSDPELISMVSQMMVAGNETTTNSLSAGMRRLATNGGAAQGGAEAHFPICRGNAET
jgi:cytochrome P450